MTKQFILVLLLAIVATSSLVHAAIIPFDEKTQLKPNQYLQKYPINGQRDNTGNLWPYHSKYTGSGLYNTLGTATLYLNVYSANGELRDTTSIDINLLSDTPWTIEEKRRRAEWNTFINDAGDSQNALFYVYKSWYYYGDQVCR